MLNRRILAAVAVITFVTQGVCAGVPTEIIGLDANHDGVRDDVAHYIDAHYGGKIALRNALLQLARAEQAKLSIDRPTPESMAAINTASLLAIECIGSVSQSYPGVRPDRLTLEMDSVIYNTDARRARQAQLDSVSGAVVVNLRSKTRDGCDFDTRLR